MLKKIFAAALSSSLMVSMLASCSQPNFENLLSFNEESKVKEYSSVVEGAALTIYVDANAKDGGDGSESAPFKSIPEAQLKIREIKSTDGLPAGGIRVFVKDGEYKITEGLRFTSEDSGTAESPITYVSESEFGAVLTGGLILSADDFDPISADEKARLIDGTAKEKVVKVDLKKYGFTAEQIQQIDSQAFEFCIDGKRASVARYPNNENVYTYIVHDIGDTHETYSDERFDVRGEAYEIPGFDYSVNNRGGTFTVEADIVDRISQWSSYENIYVNGYFKWSWSNKTVKIANVDVENDYAITLANAVSYGLSRSAPFYFFNVFDEIDMVNEFYLDTDSGYLYVYKGEDFDTSEIMISELNTTVVGLSEISHFTLRGFSVCATKGNGISASGNNFMIDHCKVYNVYCGGISASGSDITIQNCEIANVGQYGITASGGDAATLTKGNILIYNNYVHDYAEIQRTYQPAISIYGCGNTASHNDIFNGPHQGMNYSGPLQLIEYNEIGNVCYETADAGAIYAGRNMTYYGCVIRYNYIHDVGNGKAISAGIYWDDGLSGQTAYGNIVARIFGCGITGSGRDFVVENNLIIDCHNAPLYFRHLPRTQVLCEREGETYWFTHAYDLSDQIIANRETMDKESWDAAFPNYKDIIPITRDYDGDLDDPNLSINPANVSMKNNISFSYEILTGYDTGENRAHYWGEDYLMFVDVSMNPIIRNDSSAIPGVHNDDFKVLEDSIVFELCPDFEQIPFEQIGRVD